MLLEAHSFTTPVVRIESRSPSRQLMFLDFETYFDKDYSLKRMTPAEYILDERFEVIICAVILNGKPAIYNGPQFAEFLQTLDPATIITVSHNALFDNAILSYRYGWVPARMTDTLGLSRALLHHKLNRFGLAHVAEALGLGYKGDTVLKVQGMHAEDIEAAGLWPEYCTYCLNDTRLCARILHRLKPQLPAEEFRVMDLVLRCAIDPAFHVDVPMLTAYLADLRATKQSLLDRCGYDRAALMSTARFKEALEALGVTVKKKRNKKNTKDIPAFARTDKFMQELKEDPDYRVQVLAAARLSHKSTIDETRAQRFLEIAGLPWAGGPMMPVPLRYGGAHTHRLSGDWGMNCMHPDVELLTPTGWQRIEDWQPSTPVAQWWPDGKLSWETAPRKIEQFATELVWFDSPFVKGGFTRDHRMVSIREERVVERTAGWIAEHSGLDCIPVAGRLEQSETLSEAQVRLLVALAADGSRSKGGPHWQWGFHKSRKADRLRTLLIEADVDFREHKYGKRWQFVTKPVVRAYTGQPTQGHTWLQKGFGAWVLTLGSAAMDALLDEVVHWDGWANSRSGQPTFCTTDREQALWVQTVAHIRGRACTVKCYIKDTKFKLEVEQWYVYFRQSPFTSIDHSEVKAYNGKVYCPSVESSYVLARYGEGVFVTGQCQNLPRDQSKSKLRSALIAPPGHLVISADLSQIEARLCAWYCGANDLVELFRSEQDPYALMAERIFGHAVNKKVHIAERFIGKTAILSCQYGSGAPRFFSMVTTGARQYGIDLGDTFNMQVAQRTVDTYRRTYPVIPAMWRRLDNFLPQLTGNRPALVTSQSDARKRLAPIVIEYGKVILPNGLCLHYAVPNTELYGAKLLENIIQALARIVVMQAAVRLADRGYRFVLQAHDELVFIVPDVELERAQALILEEMTATPDWAPGLPVAAEIGYAQNYGESKA